MHPFGWYLAVLRVRHRAVTRVRAQQDFPQIALLGLRADRHPRGVGVAAHWRLLARLFGKGFRVDPGVTNLNYDDRLNSQLTLSTSLLGRLEGGVAFFSSNPEYGFFVRGLLVRQEDLEARGGALRWFPAVAVGMRNLGKYEHIDRFGSGTRYCRRRRIARTSRT